jgi:cytoskeleton protein RodZ
MNAMTTTPHDSKNRVAHESPGARLAQARLDSHLSHEEIATKLHLSSRQIQALEQDDYTSLPGPTYVRGYLKSYAMLLGLDPGPILELHTLRMAKPAAPDYSTIAPQKEITSRHHQVRFTTYLVMAIVIGLAFAWWQGRETRSPGLPPAAHEDEAPAPVPAETTAGAEKTEAGPQATLPAPAAGQATPAMKAAPVPDGKPSVAPAPVAAPAQPAAQPAGVAPGVATAALPAGPRVKLVLYADQDSWADIRDARQVRLLYETVPAGRVVTLEGIAPVSVFLGNAAGVRLEYNGKSVDVNQHKRGMMARFTLGEEEAAVLPTP